MLDNCPSSPERILCAHQGAELYGSDRMFIRSVEAIRRKFPDSRITVHLPQHGQIKDHLKSYCDDFVYGDMWVLRSSHLRLAYWRGLFRAPRDAWRTWRLIRRHDFVYINSVTMIGYIIASCFSFKKLAVLHIHEIPARIISILLSLFIAMARLNVVHNSKQTRKGYLSRLFHSDTMIYNGIESIVSPPPLAPDEFPDKRNTLHLLMVARYSALKGQKVVVEAYQHLPEEVRKRVVVRFVGSAYGRKTAYLNELKEMVRNMKSHSNLQLHNFSTDLTEYYLWADLVLMPSTKPESFGLVAVEAMATSRPVIASRIGGLKEIVDNGVTGQLIEPGSPDALSEEILSYIQNPDKLAIHGKNGLRRYQDHFTKEKYSEAWANYLSQF